MARVVQYDHLPGTGPFESLRIVADQRGAQTPGLALGFVQIAQQRAFRIWEVFRRDDLEPKPAHHILRRRWMRRLGERASDKKAPQSDKGELKKTVSVLLWPEGDTWA
jgi:hypothetical protein